MVNRLSNHLDFFAFIKHFVDFLLYLKSVMLENEVLLFTIHIYFLITFIFEYSEYYLLIPFIIIVIPSSYFLFFTLILPNNI